MHTRRTNRNTTEETEAIYAHWGQIGGKWTQEDNKMLLKLIKAITGLGKDCRPNNQIEEDWYNNLIEIKAENKPDSTQKQRN